MARRKNYVDNANISLDVKFEDYGIEKYPNLNPRFTVKKTSIMTSDQVANMFKFSEELILSKFNQLDMLPIVGYFVDGEPTSHDNKAVPYGAILPKTARFEMIEDEKYLVADSCLWSGKYPEVTDVSSYNQSMEVTKVTGNFNKEKGFYEVSDYTFDCLTMLNQNVNPAFKKAKMDVDANFNDDFETFKAEFAEMLQDINNNKEKGSEPMNNNDFAVVDLDRLWSSLWDKLAELYPDTVDGYCSIYRIAGIYEENGNKFVTLRKYGEENTLYKVGFIYDENGVTFDNEAIVVIEALIETGEIVKFDEPTDVIKYKEFIKEEKKDDEPEELEKKDDKFNDSNNSDNSNSENYEEKFNALQNEYSELQSKFNDLVAKYSELENEIIPLKQFKVDVEEKENKEKIAMELQQKNDLIESFATKLPKEDIKNIIDDVNKFSLEEIKSKLSVALADKILSEKIENNAKFNDIIINIDNMNKSVSSIDRLIDEVKSKKQNKI